MPILDFIFPKICLGCKKEGQYICPDCISRVPVLKPVCPYCEKPSADGKTHIKCQREFGIDGLVSIWDYEGVIRKAILALKFKYSTEVGKELAKHIIEYLHFQYARYNTLKTFTLVPIPLYWHKENIRGFNQSKEVGRLIAKEMGWGFNPDLLIKNIPTKSQVELTVKDRKQNLHGVFSVASKHPLSTNFNRLIVFDDVFTTGSTLREATEALKREGAKEVLGLTIAR